MLHKADARDPAEMSLDLPEVRPRSENLGNTEIVLGFIVQIVSSSEALTVLSGLNLLQRMINVECSSGGISSGDRLECAVCHLCTSLCSRFTSIPLLLIFLTFFFHIRALSHRFYFFLVKNQLLVGFFFFLERQ